MLKNIFFETFGEHIESVSTFYCYARIARERGLEIPPLSMSYSLLVNYHKLIANTMKTKGLTVYRRLYCMLIVC